MSESTRLILASHEGARVRRPTLCVWAFRCARASVFFWDRHDALCCYSAAAARDKHAHDTTTSEQARLPAEFKHIIKRRKRN